MDFLTTIDYVAIVTYLSIIMGIGITVHIIFYFRRKEEAGLEDYFLGGRKLPWWALGIAGMAHSMDLGGTMLIVSLFYILGPRGLFIEFRGGTCFILVFMLLWTAKWHRRSHCITGAHWMLFRFGDGFGGRFAQLAKVVGGVAFTTFMLALLIKGVSGFLPIFMPFSPVVCTLILMGVATLYSMLSGFHGLVIVDLFQALILLCAMIYVVVMATLQINGAENFAELANTVTGQPDWIGSAPHIQTDLAMPEKWPAFLNVFRPVISVFRSETHMPKGYESYRYLVLFAFCYLMKTIFNGGSTGDDPKCFGAKDDASASKVAGTWMTTLAIRWPLMMAFAVLGIFMVNSVLPDKKILDPSSVAIKQYFVNEKLIKDGQAAVELNFANEERIADIISRDKWAKDVNDITTAGPESKHAETAKKLEAALGESWREEFGRLAGQHKLVDRIIPKSKWDAKITDLANHSENYPPELVKKLKVNLGEENWKTKMHLVSWEGTVNPEKILPSVVLFMATPGFRGLILIALIAASMSTFDMSVNMCAALLTKDIYHKYVRPKAKNRELIFASWASVLLVVVIAFIFASNVESINDIWAWIMMGLFGGLTMPMLLRLYWWRFNGGGFAIGTFVGVGAAVVQKILVDFWPDLSISIFLNHELRLLIYVSLFGLAGSIAGTYLTRPTDAKLLERFYRATRPFGVWGHLKKRLPEDVRKRVSREHRNDIIAVPFGLLFHATILLMPVQLVAQSWEAFKWTFVLFLIGLGGVYLFWYRQLPAEGNFEPSLEIDDPGIAAEE